MAASPALTKNARLLEEQFSIPDTQLPTMKLPALLSMAVLATVLVSTTASSLAYPPPPRHHHDASLPAAVQRRLAHLGYYHGAIDGDIGPRSRHAIRRYQAEHGLPVTGDIDRPLLRSLGL